MTLPFAAVSCSIEVYPFEEGAYTLTPGQISEVIVTKSLRNGSVGSATIVMAPGGPFGVDSSPTWTEVLTPMSHILIGMTRGDKSAIVLDGVVVTANESQQWMSSVEGSTAVRTPVVQAADFAWFFRSFNYYALTFMGLTAGAPVGEAMGFAPAGVPGLLDQGLLGGTSSSQSNPSVVAQKWFSEVMAGQNAILGKTYVPYQGSRVSFKNSVSTVWENYPNAYIPFGDYFMSAEQSWMEKFIGILPMPWYEFFVTTAPSGAYGLASGATGTVASGATYTMASEPLAAPAGAQLVARVNPTPLLSVTSNESATETSLGTLDMTRWNALPITQPTPTEANVFFSSDINFSSEYARNFYMINPSGYQTSFGSNNASNIPYPFVFVGAADPASVHRYGFRPEIGTFRWYYDPQGMAGQNPGLNVPQSTAVMLGKLVSWFHPQPLMATATTVIPLTPDVLIGTRWRYSPFKDGLPWDFYVEEVTHHYRFGGLSTTELKLSRGLPAAVYASADANDVLQNIFTGNAMRKDGEYVVGLPKDTAPALTTFGSAESVRSVMGHLAAVFVQPQAPGQ